MSDWSKQTEAMMNTWVDTQKAIWDRWFDAIKDMGEQTSFRTLEAEQQKAMETWEASIQRGLEAQEQWTKVWTDGLKKQDAMPKPMLEWAQQMNGMMQAWLESQSQFSKNWFAAAKTMNPGYNWDAEGQKIVQAWEKAVEESLEAQKQLAKMWQGRS